MQIDINKIKKWEEFFWQHADGVTVVSENDQKIIQKAGVKNVYLVPNGVNTEYFEYKPKNPDKTKHILFTGDFKWFPNSEAINFILNNLWSDLQKKFPQINLTIVGKSIPPKIWEQQSPNLKILNKIPEIKTAYYENDLLLAPLFSGGGSRYKILEAMACGTPVITTTLGAEGINAHNNQEILIGDNKKEILRLIENLFNDDKLKEKLTLNARKLIETEYNWEKISIALEQAYYKTIN